MMKNILFLALLVFSGCAVQNEFSVSEAGKRPDNTISSYYYVLPQTVVKLSLDIQREVFIPGPYSRFAERFLGIEGTSGERSEFFDIGSVHMVLLTEPDPDKYFSINLLKGSFTAGEYLKLTSQGLVLDPAARFRKSGDVKDQFSDPEPPYFTDLSVLGFFREVTDTLYKTIVTDTSFVRLPIPRRQLEVKTLEQRAQDAANFILEIRRARFELIAGEIDGFPGGGALEFAVNELNRIEKEYMELFIGKRVKESQSRTFFIVPDGSQQEIVLFKFFENRGLAAASASGGIPLTLSIKPLDKLKNIVPVEIPEDGSLSNNLIYRIPEMASFRISLGSEEFYNERATLYQAGKLVNLPSH